MKKLKIFAIAITIASAGLSLMLSGCMKLQKDFDRVTNVDTLDAHVYTTAWGYLKSRAYSNKTPSDTIFRRMYDGIIYSGIDTLEYTKPNRTYIFLSNSNISTSSTGFWAKVLNGSTAGKNWTSYSKADVKNYLSYLIMLGQYSHYNLPLADVQSPTLAPAGAYTANPTTFKFPGTFVSNPNSLLYIHVSNANTVTSQLDYPLVLNGSTNITSSDLLATNGVIQVVNSGSTLVTPIIPQ